MLLHQVAPNKTWQADISYPSTVRGEEGQWKGENLISPHILRGRLWSSDVGSIFRNRFHFWVVVLDILLLEYGARNNTHLVNARQKLKITCPLGHKGAVSTGYLEEGKKNLYKTLVTEHLKHSVLFYSQAPWQPYVIGNDGKLFFKRRRDLIKLPIQICKLYSANFCPILSLPLFLKHWWHWFQTNDKTCKQGKTIIRFWVVHLQNFCLLVKLNINAYAFFFC